jgi:hypothetical protein
MIADPAEKGTGLALISMTEAERIPGSFSGVVASHVVREFRGKPRLRNRPFATNECNYMTGDDEGCCCPTG